MCSAGASGPCKRVGPANLPPAPPTPQRAALGADGMVTGGPELGARGGGRCNLKANRIPDRPLAFFS